MSGAHLESLLVHALALVVLPELTEQVHLRADEGRVGQSWLFSRRKVWSARWGWAWHLGLLEVGRGEAGQMRQEGDALLVVAKGLLAVVQGLSRQQVICTAVVVIFASVGLRVGWEAGWGR